MAFVILIMAEGLIFNLQMKVDDKSTNESVVKMLIFLPP